MRKIPIIGKLLLILSGFGIFSLLVAVYVGGQMGKIDSSYTALGAGPEAAAIEVAKVCIGLQVRPHLCGHQVFE